MFWLINYSTWSLILRFFRSAWVTTLYISCAKYWTCYSNNYYRCLLADNPTFLPNDDASLSIINENVSSACTSMRCSYLNNVISYSSIWTDNNIIGLNDLEYTLVGNLLALLDLVVYSGYGFLLIGYLTVESNLSALLSIF